MDLKTRLLVAMPDGALRSRTCAALAAAPGLDLLLAPTLRDAYNLTEEAAPQAALIAEAMAALPEFRSLAQVFEAIGLRWIVLSDEAGPSGPSLAPSRRGDPLLERLAALLGAAAEPSGAVAGPSLGAPAAPTGGAARLVLIGASTGGVEALLTILRTYPASCPPTVITQHTGTGYGASLAGLLDRNCAAQVLPATDHVALHPGQVVLVGGTGRHFELAPDGRSGRLTGAVPVTGHCPSVDVMFRSALPFARRVVGVLLTGMGEDGAAGLLELRRAGARTLGQDEASSVVYGMPRAAARLGALCRQVGIGELGAAILADASDTADGRRTA